MDRKTKITTCYNNAKEFIRLNKPQEARGCVLQLLNEALEEYKQAGTIVQKAKLEVFMETWIAVSRELYFHGITDLVLQNFGMQTVKEPVKEKVKKEAEKPTTPTAPIGKKRASASDGKKLPPLKQPITGVPTIDPKGQVKADDLIDIGALIDDSVKPSDLADHTPGRMGIITENSESEWAPALCEKNKRAVVRISAMAGDFESEGTGFIISKQGYLLTNDHVVFNENAGCYYRKVRFSIGADKKFYPLNVLFSDKKADVALCQFDPSIDTDFDSVKRIQNYALVRPAEECLVIGNMFGMGLAPFLGFIRFAKDDDGNLVHSAPSNPGDSGGPVFNRNGECIGINKSVTTQVNGKKADGIANATPMNTIDALLQKWSSTNNLCI